jgi:hypothetical protein
VSPLPLEAPHGRGKGPEPPSPLGKGGPSNEDLPCSKREPLALLHAQTHQASDSPHLLLRPLLLLFVLAGCSEIAVTDVSERSAPEVYPVALWVDECPFHRWQSCQTLDEDQVALIRDAVNAHFFNGDWRCQQVRDALFAKLDEASSGHVWSFDSHLDDPGGLVLGAKWYVHLGIRTSVYAAGGLELAKTGLHEAVHFLEWGEGPAQELENSCTQSA